MLTENNKEIMRNMISHHCEGLGRIINSLSKENKEVAVDLIKDIINNSEDNIYLDGLKEALKVVLEDNSNNNNNQVLCHECKYYKKVPGRPGTYTYICKYWNALTTSNEYCSHAVKEIEVSVGEAINLLSVKRNCNDCIAHFDSNCAACGLDIYDREEQDKLTIAYGMAIESLKFKNDIINILDAQINAHENDDAYKDEKGCNVLKNLKRFIIEEYMEEDLDDDNTTKDDE